MGKDGYCPRFMYDRKGKALLPLTIHPYPRGVDVCRAFHIPFRCPEFICILGVDEVIRKCEASGAGRNGPSGYTKGIYIMAKANKEDTKILNALRLFITRVSKADTSFETDFDALPEASQTFIITYGLKQILNDSVSQKEAGPEALETASAKHQALLAGTLRMSGGRASDPLAKAAIEYARELVRAKIASDPTKSLKNYTAAQITKAASGLLDLPAVKAEAKRRVDAASVEIDLDL